MEVLDVFGDDLTVVNAARVSFAKESAEFTEKDAKLVQQLAKHNHVSPFFHPQIRFRIRMPIFVAREWFRHTIGFSRNEVSRRYVSDRPECWVPKIGDLREADPRVKQGSRDTVVVNADELHKTIQDHTEGAINFQEHLIEEGVAPEIARSVLPQSMYTEFIETGSLAAQARLYNLRIGPDAQKEIRTYATMLGSLLENLFPISWAALTTQQPTAST